VPSLTYVPSSTCVPSLAYKPSSVFVPSFGPIFVCSSDDDSEDENPPPPAHLPKDKSNEHEPALAPLLPRWVHSKREDVGDLANDPSYQCQTNSQFQ
jgi:hypothetical protein